MISPMSLVLDLSALGFLSNTAAFPAPRKIKSIVSVYNSRKHGTLRTYNYESVKGEPRRGWTYRAYRRNAKYGRL